MWQWKSQYPGLSARNLKMVNPPSGTGMLSLRGGSSRLRTISPASSIAITSARFNQLPGIGNEHRVYGHETSWFIAAYILEMYKTLQLIDLQIFLAAH